MTVVINGTTGIDTGTGSLIAADSTTPTYLDLFEDTDNGSNYVRLIAPTSVASNKTITLPDATGTMIVGSAAVSAVGQIPFSTDGSSYTPTAKIVSGSSITLTNQTAPDFTSIPPWVKRITLMTNAVSTNSTGIPLVQLGDSGGYEITNYSAIAALVSTTSNTTRGTASTSGFPLIYAGGATEAHSGSLIFSLLGSNTWVCTGSLYVSTGGTGLSSVSGVKTLSDTLTSIRLYIDGTQFFDAGTINILYE